MASEGAKVEELPENLDVALSLNDDTAYVLQNKSDHRLFLVVQAATPQANTASNNLKEQFVEAGAAFAYTPVLGSSLFGYYKNGGDGVVASVEA